MATPPPTKVAIERAVIGSKHPSFACWCRTFQLPNFVPSIRSLRSYAMPSRAQRRAIGRTGTGGAVAGPSPLSIPIGDNLGRRHDLVIYPRACSRRACSHRHNGPDLCDRTTGVGRRSRSASLGNAIRRNEIRRNNPSRPTLDSESTYRYARPRHATRRSRHRPKSGQKRLSRR